MSSPLSLKTAQIFARAAAAHDHVVDADAPQGLELAHDLVGRADQAHRRDRLGRVIVGQDVGAAGMISRAKRRKLSRELPQLMIT